MSKLAALKRSLLFFSLASLAFFLPHLSLAETSEPPIGKPRFGMLLPLSGNYSVIGVDNQNGIKAAQALQQTPSPVEFEFADSKTEPTTAVSEFRKFTSDKNLLGVFAMRGPIGMAINPLSASLEIPLFGGVGNKDFAKANPYAFQLWSNSADEGGFVAQRLQKKGFTKIALLTAQDDWPEAVTAGVRAGLKASPAQIVFDNDVIPGDSDFRTLILQIKAKKPDAVFANLGIAQLGPFFKQAKELQLSAAFYSNFWATKKEVIESAGVGNVEGVRFVEMDTGMPHFQKALATLDTPQGKATSSAAALSTYAGTLLILQVFKENPSLKTRQEFYTQLLKQTAIHTPDGDLEIRDRCVIFPLVEKQISQGKSEIVP